MQRVCDITRKKNFSFLSGSHSISIVSCRSQLSQSPRKSWLLAWIAPHQWSSARTLMVWWRITNPTRYVHTRLYMRWVTQRAGTPVGAAGKGHGWVLHAVTRKGKGPKRKWKISVRQWFRCTQKLGWKGEVVVTVMSLSLKEEKDDPTFRQQSSPWK